LSGLECRKRSSLRSKRFRGVDEQRKNGEDFRVFFPREIGARAKKKKKQPLPPLFFFGSRLTFWFLGFSLLPNLTETLATQA